MTSRQSEPEPGWPCSRTTELFSSPTRPVWSPQRLFHVSARVAPVKARRRAFCEQFFTYYNHEHRHSGIALHTPASVHYGTATQVRHQRRTTLHAAYDANPTRFRHRRPSSLDQPAQQGGPHTEQLDSNCLNGLDTFRDGGRGGDPSDDLGAACFLSKDETGADEPDPGHCAGKGVRGYGL